jgi:prophage regulatory protein
MTIARPAPTKGAAVPRKPASQTSPYDVIGRSGDDPPAKLIRFSQLEARYGISFSRMHVGRLEKSGQFPKRIRFGKNSVAWLSTELEAWVAARRAVAPPPPSLQKAQAASVTARRAKAAEKETAA